MVSTTWSPTATSITSTHDARWLCAASAAPTIAPWTGAANRIGGEARDVGTISRVGGGVRRGPELRVVATEAIGGSVELVGDDVVAQAVDIAAQARGHPPETVVLAQHGDVEVGPRDRNGREHDHDARGEPHDRDFGDAARHAMQGVGAPVGGAPGTA